MDSEYRVGQVCDLYLVMHYIHARYHKGTVRIVKIDLKKLSELTDEFIAADADCSREEFFRMMEGWYGRKPDWKGWDSEVQVLHLERIESNASV